MDFPNDADGEVLQGLFEDGVNFNEPHIVDFFVAVPNEEKGKKVENLVREKGFNTELSLDEDSNEWTCYCSIKMLLKYEDIIDIQNQLDELSEPFDGYSDGWGVMVD